MTYGLACDARCVFATTPVEACTCTRCHGTHHGSRPRPAEPAQLVLFPECGADNLSRPAEGHRASVAEAAGHASDLPTLPDPGTLAPLAHEEAHVTGDTSGGPAPLPARGCAAGMVEAVNGRAAELVAQRLREAAPAERCSRCDWFLRRPGSTLCARCEGLPRVVHG